MRQALFLFNWKPVDRRYLPGRGLALSVIVHGMFFCGLPFLALLGSVAGPPPVLLAIDYIDFRDAFKDPDEDLYLPTLVYDDAVSVAPDERPKPVGSKVMPVSAPNPKGLTYPGPQPIESDFPEPTNSMLTILQPSLLNPQLLRQPLLLPNIVQFGAAKLLDPKLLIEPKLSANPDLQQVAKVTELPIKAVPPPLVELPKPILPVAPPAMQKIELPVAEPMAKPVQPLLVLSPIPAPRLETLSLPEGEARGRFSISPEANLAAMTSEPGPKPSPRDDVAKDRVVPAPVAETPKVVPASAVPAPVAGTNPGTGRGNSNAFPGITILGGSSDTGNSRASSNIISIGTPAPPIQTSYGITIVSTESSGGGLPQYGVFSNEQKFTVYLDMRRTPAESAPTWVFEYAVLKAAAAQTSVISGAPANPARSLQGLVLPFPVVKEQPVLSSDLMRKYSRTRLIVYAVVNTDGKMEQISIKESPDPLLNPFVLSTLGNWVFRPAQLDGEKIPMKVLIGIPLS